MICDVPNFGLVTTMTDDLEERKNLNFVRSLFSLLAGIAVSSVVSVFRKALGGWTSTAVTVSLIGVLTMLPICLFGFGSAWSLYIAGYCLGGEEMASVVTLISVVPTLLGTMLAPVLRAGKQAAVLREKRWNFAQPM